MDKEPTAYDILHSFFVGVIAFLVIVVMLVFGLVTSCFGAISGQTEVVPGTLARFESDIEGDALVYPVGNATFAKDSNGKAVYFASPKDGEYTLIFFGIRDGKPEITTHTFVVGNPEPTPDPTPSPTPDVKLTDVEKKAVLESMQAVLDGLEQGNIRTPQGARAAFKNALVAKVGKCTSSGCTLPTGVTQAIKTWEASMDITTLDGIKAGFTKIKEGLQ